MYKGLVQHTPVGKHCGYTLLTHPTLCRMLSKFTQIFLGALLIAGVWSLLEKQKVFREPGTDVMIPGEELRKEHYYEIKLENRDPDWMAVYHGGPQVHLNFEGRGEFLDNGSFSLWNLTKNDSGVYVYYINQKIHYKMELTVIDPMDQPILKRIDRRDEECLTRLECLGSGGNVSFFHNGLRVSDSATKKGNVLHIEGTRQESWGTYICQLMNQAGVKSSSKVVIPNQASWHDLVAFYASVPVVVFMLILGVCRVYACTANKPEESSANTGGRAGSRFSRFSRAIVLLEFSLLILCDFGRFFASFYFYQYNPYWPFLVSFLFALIFLFRIILLKLKYVFLKFVDTLLQVADVGTLAFCLVVIVLFLIKYSDSCAKRVYMSLGIPLLITIPVLVSFVIFWIIYFSLKCRAGHNDSVANMGFTMVETGDSSEKGDPGDFKAPAEDLFTLEDTDLDVERSTEIRDNDGTMLPGEHNENEASGPNSTIRYCERPIEDTQDQEGLDQIMDPGDPTLFGEGSAGEPDTNG